MTCPVEMEQARPVRGPGQAEDWVTAGLRRDLPRVLDKAAALAVLSIRGEIFWNGPLGGFSDCAWIQITIVNKVYQEVYYARF